MIRAKIISVKDFRGIRDLTLDLGGGNFAICGPNGTGKSGVVDALEFALTGSISRLSGAGTGGLSIKDHGPHVDSRNKPENASVSLTIYIPSLKKDATVVRTVKDPKNPRVTPNDPDVRAIISKVELHPEFALSRRELIRYVLAEPGKRAKEVQELLRLEEVETLRALFQKISNSCDRDEKLLRSARDEAGIALQRALKLTKLSATEILSATNERRLLLSLPPLNALEANTSIKDGVVTAAAATPPISIAKVQARTDLDLLRDKIQNINNPEFLANCAKISAAIEKLSKDEGALGSSSRESLLQNALRLFDAV